MLREMYAMDMNGVTVSYLRDNAVLLKNIPAKIGSWYMYRKTAELMSAAITRHSALWLRTWPG